MFMILPVSPLHPLQFGSGVLPFTQVILDRHVAVLLFEQGYFSNVEHNY